MKPAPPCGHRISDMAIYNGLGSLYLFAAWAQPQRAVMIAGVVLGVMHLGFAAWLSWKELRQ